jgi:hypothetical protein
MTNSWVEPPSRPALESALPALLKQLKLAQFRSQWQAAEQQATADGWSPASYLYVLAEQEHQQRHQARLRRLLHEAQLRVPKTLAEIDWGAIPDLDRHQIEQLAHDTGWLDRAENLLLYCFAEAQALRSQRCGQDPPGGRHLPQPDRPRPLVTLLLRHHAGAGAAACHGRLRPGQGAEPARWASPAFVDSPQATIVDIIRALRARAS